MCTFLVPYMCIIIAVVLIHCLNVNYKYNKIIDVVILSTQHLKKKNPSAAVCNNDIEKTE